jgi:Fur family ferric uptake transcriptional regulator
MTCTMHRTQELRQRGFRMTPQRQVILQILESSTGHLSPAEIFKLARTSVPGLTEATVYRTLDFLSQNEMIHPAHTASGHLVYEFSGDDHHHLVCRLCGQEVRVESSWVNPAQQEIENHTRYHLDVSHLVFFGTCPDCLVSSKAG